ncbi:hypothetical protein [Streptomyces sp. NBC_00280]|uniref:hypothetical protein n=1 Tax=Streptomyces sp. NBC_00280 TaxID=2975699 RepID=UPI003246D1D4
MDHQDVDAAVAEMLRVLGPHTGEDWTVPTGPLEWALSTLTGRQMIKKENPRQILSPAGRFGASFAESEVKATNHLLDHLTVRQT